MTASASSILCMHPDKKYRFSAHVCARARALFLYIWAPHVEEEAMRRTYIEKKNRKNIGLARTSYSTYGPRIASSLDIYNRPDILQLRYTSARIHPYIARDLRLQIQKHRAKERKREEI